MTRLIHFPENKIGPTGGPAGYLYNLREGLAEIGAEGYEFLPATSSELSSNKIIQRIVPNRIKDKRRLRNLLALPSVAKDAPVDYSQYESIHFHSTEDLYYQRNSLENYSGKVILTSHSPCAYHLELLARLNPKDAKNNAKSLSYLSIIDEFAFSRADFVVFPCPEAEEPYFNTWKTYASIREETKLRYLPTGIKACVAKLSRDEIRSRFNIPKESFVVSYVGRHNKMKGYDDLVSVAPAILKSDDTWVLVAGKIGRIPAPSHKQWVEVGWTNDPHSIIAAADLLILPNRETYFDLVLLEALSLGQLIITTRTGGNKHFDHDERDSGIVLIDDIKELPLRIAELKLSSNDRLAHMREQNKRLFENFYTLTVFASEYVKLMESL